MKFVEFALYFFTCHIVYDIIFNIIRSIYIERKLKQIRIKLEQEQIGEVTWN